MPLIGFMMAPDSDVFNVCLQDVMFINRKNVTLQVLPPVCFVSVRQALSRRSNKTEISNV